VNKEKIRILHIVERYQRRGAELFGARLASTMSNNGFDVSICSLYEAQSSNFPVPKSVSFLHPLAKQRGIFARIGFQPSILTNLGKLYKSYKPGVVIAHGADTLRYAALAGIFYPEALILYINIGLASYWVNNHFKNLINRKFLQLTDGVVSVCESSREDFIHVYSIAPGKVFTIYNGIDVEPYKNIAADFQRNKIRTALHINDKSLVLISVGSISEEKNQEVLLTLTYDLREIPVHLLLVGDGPLRKELESKAEKLGISEIVHFTGVQEDVKPWLAASDIFVLPSKSEGMPGVLIEAGLMGLPSVAYDVGGVKEVLGENSTGIVVHPAHFKDFESATASLLGAPDKRISMGSLAKKLYPEKFGMDRIVDEYNTLIYRLLSEKRNTGHD
jgi:L-malate glycosyltransferase